MKKILVAGGGHGGLVAAIKLAKNGYTVTVFEKEKRENMSHEQTDAVDVSAFEYANIEIPREFPLGKNEVTFIPLDRELGTLDIPPQSETSVFADRKRLVNFLIDTACDSGVEIRYGEEILCPLVLGNRVCGIKTSSGEYYGDLVIDACGVNSPVRNGLPSYMNVNRPRKNYDVLHSYRAYFNRIENAPSPKTNFNVILKDDGTEGLRWLVTEKDRIDVLICRFNKPTDEEIDFILKDLRKDNPHMGEALVCGGERSVIPVCQPLALLIANGYAAVGDSAYMTFSVKGSGLTYSFKAGTILAEVIMNDKDGCYDREHLWEYQKRFFKEIGNGACTVAVCKNLLPYMKAEDVNTMFKLKLFTSEELSLLWENKADAVLNAKGINTIKDKLKAVIDEPRMKELFGGLAVWFGRIKLLQTQFPNKYNNKDIEEWVERYNKFFDSIRYDN